MGCSNARGQLVAIHLHASVTNCDTLLYLIGLPCVALVLAFAMSTVCCESMPMCLHRLCMNKR